MLYRSQGSERQELQEFTALEFDIHTAEELSLRQQAGKLQAAGEQRAAELGEARSKLADTEAALQQREDEVRLAGLGFQYAGVTGRLTRATRRGRCLGMQHAPCQSIYQRHAC
mgnify:CR=1 FL=1